MANTVEFDVNVMTSNIITAVKASIETSQQDVINQAAEKAVQLFDETLKRKSSDIQHSAVQESIKRFKVEQPKLRRIGNQRQFECNLDILEHLDNADRSLNNNKIEDAKNEIQKGKQLVLKRQKLIKIADREEDGWHVVNEYLADELASDSEDEKQISKARKSAAAKKKVLDAKRKKFNVTNSNDTKPYNKQDNNKFGRNRPTHYSTQPQYNQKYDFRINKYDRNCGRKGHMLYNCPDKKLGNT